MCFLSPSLSLSLPFALALALASQACTLDEESMASGTERADEGAADYPAEARAQWDASPFTLLRAVEVATPAGVEIKGRVPLEAVVFQDSEPAHWTLEETVQRYQKVAEVYGECGVVFSPLRVIEVAPPHSDLLTLFDSTTSNVQSHIEYQEELANERFDNNTGSVAEMIPRTAALQNLHIRGFLDGGSSVAGAFYHLGRDPFFFEESEPLVYRSWLVANITSDDYKAGVPEGYSTEGHELGHILLNEGHVTEGDKNIMGFPAEMLSDSFSEEQCDKILSSTLITRE